LPAPHLIFDFDGTLIDSSPAILDTLDAVLRARNVFAVRPLGNDLIGLPLMKTLQSLTGETDPELLEKLATDFRLLYDTKGLLATQAFPGVRETLQKLVASARHVSIATNKRRKPTQLLLKHLRWLPWFDAVYCVDSRDPPFPHKGEMLEHLMADLGLEPMECLYIGDTRHDEEAAAFARIPFVAVQWGYGIGGQAFGGDVRVLRRPEELLGL
jgi:phosphoglycolate phosphatase